MTSRDLAILMTPPGPAAIAVVRLTGEGVDRFLQRHFSRPVPQGRCVHGQLIDAERVIDDPVVVRMERCADLNLHGGPWVVRATLDLAARAGFEVIDRPALPLMAEAVDAGDVIQREVLSYLPLAKTELALRALLAQPAAWEAFLAAPRMDAIAGMLGDRSLEHLLHPPHVAIVGPVNVGKSTLANRLFAQERSITADMPGTTRDWVGEIANMDGLAVMLLDTPGIRQTTDEIERIAIGRSAERIGQADCVVLVLDQSIALAGAQAELMSRYPQAIRVANKSDHPTKWDADDVGAIRTVAITGVGIDALRRAILSRFQCEAIDPHLPRCWTDRQRDFLKQLGGVD